MKIHTGDTVLVITGKDRGKVGSVLRVLTDRVVVSGINMRTRHIKKTAQRAGQRIRYEASIAVGNVMLLDPKTKKPTRIGYRIDAAGHKTRIALVSGEVIAKVSKVSGKKKGVEAEEAKEKAAPAKKKAAKKEEAKEGKEGTIEQVTAPPRKPFWKKLAFGSQAIDEESQETERRTKPDNTVPEQTRIPESFTHKRGD